MLLEKDEVHRILHAVDRLQKLDPKAVRFAFFVSAIFPSLGKFFRRRFLFALFHSNSPPSLILCALKPEVNARKVFSKKQKNVSRETNEHNLKIFLQIVARETFSPKQKNRAVFRRDFLSPVHSPHEGLRREICRFCQEIRPYADD